MLEAIVSELSKKSINIFGKTLKNVALDTKFTKRPDEAKLKPNIFVKILLQACSQSSAPTLSQMKAIAKMHKIQVSESAIAQRMNEPAMHMMKLLFEHVQTQLKIKNKDVIKLLEPFACVEALDSTNISLPDSLASSFKACGGNASKAGIKLQTRLDILDKQITDVTITDATQNDQSFKDYLEDIQESGLYLRDLGYFSKESLYVTAEKGGYFISRFFSQTTVYNANGDKIDLLKLLYKHQSEVARKVYLGKRKHLPIRLIAKKLDKKDYKNRVKSIREKCRKKGRQPTKERLEFAKWSICITNVEEERLKDEEIYLVYSTRWQIELLFKLCKQEVGIDKVKSANKYRVLCEIYAKLICVTILMTLCASIKLDETQEISLTKAFKVFRLHAFDFFKALTSPYRMTKIITYLRELFEQCSLKNIRKKSLSTQQKLVGAYNNRTLNFGVAKC